jgi:hypothetical protein
VLENALLPGWHARYANYGQELFLCATRRRLIADRLGTCSLTGFGFYQRLVAIHAPFYSGRFEIPVAPESSSCGPP